MKIIILENNFLFKIISSISFSFFFLTEFQNKFYFLGTISHFKKGAWASFVVQWLRIHLAIQGTTAIFLVQEDLACHRAAKPVCHSCGTCALEPRATTSEPECCNC